MDSSPLEDDNEVPFPSLVSEDVGVERFDVTSQGGNGVGDELDNFLAALETEDFDALDAPYSQEDSGLETPNAHSKIDPVAQEPLDNDSVAQKPSEQLVVAIPELSPDQKAQYLTVMSEIVEAIVGQTIADDGLPAYRIQLADGRDKVIKHSEVLDLEGGSKALSQFKPGRSGDMWEPDRKRKLPNDEWDSENEDEEEQFDEMDIDERDSDIETTQARRLTRSEGGNRVRLLRSREASTRASSRLQSIASDDDDADPLMGSDQPGPRRNLRARKPQQLRMVDNLQEDDDDELQKDDEFVVSDLMPKGRPSRRPRRLQQRAARQIARPARFTRNSPDSDIEFEAPRRSGRSTQTKISMKDDEFMDDDSFYVVDDKTPAAPKIVSVREVFQPIASESEFASVHMPTCHTCGGSKQKGQLVYCQGCSLTFHKHCLGYRSAREHMVTKVDESSFVLQCKFCIGIYNKKDKNAPKHSMCQGCKKTGKACAAFSQRKTARQEEKLREENGGTDPITRVSPDLLDNARVSLIRCTTCHRGWHLEHLASPAEESIGTDLESEAFKDFAIDWQCNDCSTAKHKIHRLVAWRPLQQDSHQLSFHDVTDDYKEYLIKWETLSYFHCTWMPGAWVFGISPSAMRAAFAKRDAEQDLKKLTEKEAIPDEYLMADIIFKVKVPAARARSRQADLESIHDVSKVLVKFQGLGYDDVVWDSPPSQDQGEMYQAFVDAYHEYVYGKYFQHDSRVKIRDRVKAYHSAPFEEVTVQPSGLKRGKLMGYQIEGLNWLLKNYHQGRSVVLADEMGLGKTVQVVGMVTYLVQENPKCWPFLIVVPNATCPNWRREFKQWAPDLRVVTYHGGKEPQELAYKYELFPDGSSDMRAHAVIMSYDSAQDPRTRTLFHSIHWAGLVVDEGQRLKNEQSLLYVALKAMRIPFRLLLTGTPLQNNKRELFNLLQFIDESQDASKLDEEYAILDKETLPKLHEKIRPYFLRRTKAGVLKFLPPMAQIILPVTMTVIQEKLSKSIMAKNPQLIRAVFANSKLNRNERGSLNNILMQLRKCLCHPFMYSEAIEERHHDSSVLHRNLVEASAKLILLEIMLPKLKERGHRVLIFSQFLQQLDIVEDFLSGMGYDFRRLDGQISSLEKQRRIDAFNEPDSPIFAFLLSTRAGGVGINLATADTVIIMDPDFNPHQDMQALSRAHRIGQKKKVLCFQLVTKDSVEEKIMQAGRRKMALDHALIESMDDDELIGDDLESILKHGAQALFNDDYQKQAIHYDSASVDKLLDRSQVEQTKTNEDGSAETQFSFARVWANNKSGFEDGLAMEEEEAPEPISSGVWDKILAQREEEARKEAAANKEILGRGGRRRMAINYKANALEQIALPEGMEAESSDSTDEFAGADSSGESDGEETLTKGKRKAPEVKGINPLPTPPSKKTRSTKIDTKSKQTRATRHNGTRHSPSKSKPAPRPKPSTPNKRVKTSHNLPTPKSEAGGLSPKKSPPSSPSKTRSKAQRLSTSPK